MNRSVCFPGTLKAGTALALISAALSSNSWASPPDDTVTVRAAETKAAYYAELATFYRSRAVAGSKQMITYFTMANRADGLAEHYHLAAVEGGNRG
jgi:hypothetical protein